MRRDAHEGSKMKQIKYSNRFTNCLLGSAALAACLAMPAYAQDQGGGDQTTIADAITSTEEEKQVQDKIVVTGSRIKRDTFSSVAPLQIISGQGSREVGLIDPADILQESTAASGIQIDDSFGGSVTDNGPGSHTVSLRGLGAGRTLALINGRRLAPIGVEGAPADASINLIPSSFVDNYQILLDGASSVYGSDAVAGVANVILKKDYDGFEVGMNNNLTQDGGGEQVNLYGSWGKQMDKGFVAVAVDYEKTFRQRLDQRSWSEECEKNAEITESGEVRSTNIELENTYPGMGTSSCDYFPLGGRIFLNGSRLGSVYFTPGSTNTGIPNFSDSQLFSVNFDGNNDGLADFSFFDYTTNGTGPDRYADLTGEGEQFSAMLLGEYDIGILGDATAYTELMHVTADFVQRNAPGQIFQDVPGTNPYNPCNPNGINGVDCGAAFTNAILQADNGYRQNFIDYYGAPPEAFGGIVTTGPLGALSAQPITTIYGDRDNVESKLSQTRLVAGIEGDLPLNFGSLTDWTYDASLVYSRSTGKSSRLGVREDRLIDSLNTSAVDPSSGNIVCGIDTNGDGVPDGALADGTPCVPVNLFASSLLGSPIGSLATQAEHDYLFDDRSFDTTYEQTMLSFFVTGTLAELPAGALQGVFGTEWRRDKLESDPSEVASEGLLWGFFKDRGAQGEKDIFELYGELAIPILTDQFLAKDLSMELSGRYTDEEFAGDASTYSVKLSYRPTDFLQFRGTMGTSFRAPNVREQFLQGQSGFATLSDPCVVPADAYNALTDTYDPSQDDRDAVTLANCSLAGLDPTRFGNTSTSNYSVEVFQIGSAGTGGNALKPETSESYSYGFVFEQPFTEAFEMKLGLSYYDISIDDSISQLAPGFIVNQCYVAVENQNSPFCSLISRDADGFLNAVDYPFVNIASETASGWDVNFLLEKEFTIGDRELSAVLDITANRIDEVTFKFGDEDREFYQGEFGFAQWSGEAIARFDYDDYRFVWRTNWQDGVEQDSEFIDEYSDIDGSTSTCGGPTRDDELCRDIGFADEYAVHTASISYLGESWTLTGGIRNLFDEAPPFVDPSEVATVRGTNAPRGAGYDLRGRTFFINVRKEF